jgi:exopolysaccharide biosynthesis protein
VPLIKIVLLFILSLWCAISSHAAEPDYHYEVQRKGSHTIHIATIDPEQYNISIVKARNGTRETVPSLAQRLNADIAINAGFFEIGDARDGKPSGTLIIKGKVYGLKNRIQPLLVLNADTMSIQAANPTTLYNQKSSNSLSMVSGIPMLINNGNIVEGLSNKKGYFYEGEHARTAVGIKADGTIVIVVSEHQYQRDLGDTKLRSR